MKNRVLLVVFLLVGCFQMVSADEPKKFSPEKFDAEMEKFITQEAKLSADEAAKFFPMLREMHKKQRSVFTKIQKECRHKPSDEADCRKVVESRDRYELELKTIQQQYHKKFLSILSASKVYDVIIAEDRFHRHAIRNFSHGIPRAPRHR